MEKEKIFDDCNCGGFKDKPYSINMSCCGRYICVCHKQIILGEDDAVWEIIKIGEVNKRS